MPTIILHNKYSNVGDVSIWEAWPKLIWKKWFAMLILMFYRWESWYNNVGNSLIIVRYCYHPHPYLYRWVWKIFVSVICGKKTFGSSLTNMSSRSSEPLNSSLSICCMRKSNWRIIVTCYLTNIALKKGIRRKCFGANVFKCLCWAAHFVKSKIFCGILQLWYWYFEPQVGDEETERTDGITRKQQSTACPVALEEKEH